MHSFRRFVLVAALLTPAALANDGFGGLSATGLQFDRTAAVQMLSEDLYVSVAKIKVAYVFRNSGGEDVTGEVIFPLPPIDLASLQESDFAIPREKLDRPNVVNFTAAVDGKPLAVQSDRIAVVQPPYDEKRPVSAGYTAPGRDVTAELRRHGIPLTLDPDTATAAIGALPQAARADLAAQGIIYLDGDAVMPAWSVIERFHWTQTFPAGRDVAIEHSYDGAFPGGIFVWSEPTEPESYQQELISKYCIDEGTQKAIKGALAPSGDGAYWNGMAYYVDYVLTTANTWAGPIGRFKLTLDKGNPKNVVTLCVDGIRKTGPTTFVVEKADFAPASDLSILVIPSVDTLPR
jgi:hypothetical protein